MGLFVCAQSFADSFIGSSAVRSSFEAARLIPKSKLLNNIQTPVRANTPTPSMKGIPGCKGKLVGRSLKVGEIAHHENVEGWRELAQSG